MAPADDIFAHADNYSVTVLLPHSRALAVNIGRWIFFAITSLRPYLIVMNSFCNNFIEHLLDRHIEVLLEQPNLASARQGPQNIVLLVGVV